MSIANKLMKLAAKVALDRVLGKERTDELGGLFREWAQERDQAKALAQVREQAADPKAVSEAVNVAIAGAGQTVSNDVRNDLEVAVAAGIGKLVDPPSEEWLQDTFLPGVSKVYVVFSGDHRLTGGQPGRFFHFNWDRDSYSVRDYIGRRILHAHGTSRSEAGLKSEKINMTALGVWNASAVRIHSKAEYGLGFDRTEQDRWRKVLNLLTEAARQMTGR